MPENHWNPVLYESKHSFIWQYGEELLNLLSPQPGERILDLGCGTGQLTEKIASDLLSGLSAEERSNVIQAVEHHLKPSLYQDGIWIADYRRIRVVAIKVSGMGSRE